MSLIYLYIERGGKGAFSDFLCNHYWFCIQGREGNWRKDIGWLRIHDFTSAANASRGGDGLTVHTSVQCYQRSELWLWLNIPLKQFDKHNIVLNSNTEYSHYLVYSDQSWLVQQSGLFVQVGWCKKKKVTLMIIMMIIKIMFIWYSYPFNFITPVLSFVP